MRAHVCGGERMCTYETRPHSAWDLHMCMGVPERQGTHTWVTLYYVLCVVYGMCVCVFVYETLPQLCVRNSILCEAQPCRKVYVCLLVQETPVCMWETYLWGSLTGVHVSVHPEAELCVSHTHAFVYMAPPEWVRLSHKGDWPLCVLMGEPCVTQLHVCGCVFVCKLAVSVHQRLTPGCL